MELLLMYFWEIVVGVLVGVNLVSFFVMGNDKRKAVQRKKSGGSDDVRRTPEGFIFFMAALFGSIGVYAGILVFHHKIRKWYFQLGIPLMILQNLATIYLVWEVFI